MTADVELLPCPFCGDVEHLLVEHLEGTILHPAHRIRCDNCGASTGYTDKDFRADWNTRANVAHATAAKDAEIEALRAEVERLEIVNRLEKGVAEHAVDAARAAEARIERLAEALREIERRMPKGVAGPAWIARTIASEALRAALNPTAPQ